MGFLKNLIYGDPEKQGMMYRIRVFDHGHHIKTATVKDRGQDHIDLVVKPKDYFILGEEVKLAFMVNPEIPPRYFGNTQEIDFDVRDSTQLADLFDLCPNLVYQLNQNLHDTLKALKKDTDIIDAEFTEKKEEETGKTVIDDNLTALTDPIPEKDPPVQKELTDLEQKAMKVPGVKAITHTLDAVALIKYNFQTNVKAASMLMDINYASTNQKQQELMKKVFEFCMTPGNQKCLRWLPKYLHIEPEVTAIVSQTELDGVGIMPMYYIKQSAAEIAEKILQRPKQPEDWKTTLIYGAIALAILMLTVFFVLKLSGRM